MGLVFADEELALVAMYVTVGLYVLRFATVGALRWLGAVTPPESPRRKSAGENTADDESKALMFAVVFVLVYAVLLGGKAAANWLGNFIDHNRQLTAAIVAVAGYYAVRACSRWARS